MSIFSRNLMSEFYLDGSFYWISFFTCFKFEFSDTFNWFLLLSRSFIILPDPLTNVPEDLEITDSLYYCFLSEIFYLSLSDFDWVFSDDSLISRRSVPAPLPVSGKSWFLLGSTSLEYFFFSFSSKSIYSIGCSCMIL